MFGSTCRKRSLRILFGLLPCVPFFAASGAASLTLSGSVAAPGGGPAIGARVEVRPVLSTYEAGRREIEGAPEPRPLAWAQVDAAGRFALVVPAPGLFRVRIELQGAVPVERAPQVAVEDLELPPAELERDVGATLRMLDEGGRGIPRARSFAEPDRADERLVWPPAPRIGRTGSGGEIRIPRCADESLTVAIGSPGRAEIVVADVTGDREVRLPPASLWRELSLRASDVGGTPLADALIRGGSRGRPVALTDREGRARLLVPAGERISVGVATADGRAAVRSIDPNATPGHEVELTLPSQPSFAVGRVRRAESGTPLVGALVWLVAEPGRTSITDAAGEFRLIAWPARSPRLSAAAAGYLRGGRALDEAEVQSGRLPPVALRATVPLAGRTTSADGRPLAGVDVEARAGSRADGPVADRTRSGPDGRFELRRLAGGATYWLRASRAGFMTALHEASTPLAPRPLPPVAFSLAPARAAVGRVVDTKGRPVARVRVILSRSAEDDAKEDPPQLPRAAAVGGETAEATTDAAGRFHIKAVPAAEVDLVAVRVGFAPTRQRHRRLPAGAVGTPRAWNLGDLILRPGAAVVGRVVDAAGRPIAGARIDRASRIAEAAELERDLARAAGSGASEPENQPDATSSGDGRFRLENLPAGTPVHLLIRATGYLAATVPGVRPPTAEPLVVRLAAGARVVGKVIDEQGAGIEGASVRLEGRARIEEVAVGAPLVRRATSDAEGRFEIPDAPAGPIEIGAQARGFLTGAPRAESAPTPFGTEIEIRLERGAATLLGGIATRDGEAVAGARIVIGEVAAISDADGAYRLEGLRVGPVRAELFHPRYRRQERRLSLEAGTNQLDFEVEPGRRVAGLVIDERGEVVADAEVQLETGEPSDRTYRLYRARSAADGRFELAPIVDGEYRISAEAMGFAPARPVEPLVISERDVDDLRIALARGGAIAGRITGLDAEQLARVEVSADGTGEDSPRGRVEPDGGYALRDLAAGVWEVRARLTAEQREVAARVLVANGEIAARDLEFGGRLSLAGRVELAGEPLVEARVALRGEQRGIERSALTDHGGSFRIEDLESGPYVLSVSQSRELVAHNERITLDANREIVIRLETGSLAGRVRDSTSGEPVTQAIAQVFPLAGLVSTRAAGTDGQGRYRLPRVPPGRYRLRISAEGYSAAEREVEVPAGSADAEPSATADVDLEPALGLALRVALASGAVPGSVAVRAESLEGALAFEQKALAPDGGTRLTTLGPGNWNLRVAAPGGALFQRTVKVPGPELSLVLADAALLSVSVAELLESDRVGTVALADPTGRRLEWLAPTGQVLSLAPLVGGRAEVPAVPAGSWLVLVDLGDGRTYRATALTDGRRAVEVEAR